MFGKVLVGLFWVRGGSLLQDSELDELEYRSLTLDPSWWHVLLSMGVLLRWHCTLSAPSDQRSVYSIVCLSQNSPQIMTLYLASSFFSLLFHNRTSDTLLNYVRELRKNALTNREDVNRSVGDA